jgi:MFS family permease
VSLDLEIVDRYSGLATAAFFAPTTLAMVVAGPLGGRWAARAGRGRAGRGRAGPGRPLVAGLACGAVAAAALDAVLRRPVAVAPTVAALAALGFGLGLVVAPVVGTVLARLPARRSGAAAAAVTAAREGGGVLGIAVLGAIVDGLLFARLTGRLHRLGIPLAYRQHVVDAVRGGAPLPRPVVPASGSFVDRYLAAIKQTLIDRTVDAGKAAYVDSLRVALLVAVGVLAAAAVGVGLLTRHTGADTPTDVGGRC